MKQWIRINALSAAVAAIPLILAGSIYGQQRINTDGHALDASNRVGSSGVNPDDSSKRVAAPLNGNDIVTGNVTGGKQFRGQVPYTDPRPSAIPTAPTGLIWTTSYDPHRDPVQIRGSRKLLSHFTAPAVPSHRHPGM